MIGAGIYSLLRAEGVVVVDSPSCMKDPSLVTLMEELLAPKALFSAPWSFDRADWEENGSVLLSTNLPYAVGVSASTEEQQGEKETSTHCTAC